MRTARRAVKPTLTNVTEWKRDETSSCNREQEDEEEGSTLAAIRFFSFCFKRQQQKQAFKVSRAIKVQVEGCRDQSTEDWSSWPLLVCGRGLLSLGGHTIYFQTPGMTGMFSPLGYQFNVSLPPLPVHLFICKKRIQNSHSTQLQKKKVLNKVYCLFLYMHCSKNKVFGCLMYFILS